MISQVAQTDSKSAVNSRDNVKAVDREQWVDTNPRTFTKEQVATTTLLVSGLTYAHDILVRAAFASHGFNIKVLDVADNAALAVGKEFPACRRETGRH